jgi:hypothetical protein
MKLLKKIQNTSLNEATGNHVLNQAVGEVVRMRSVRISTEGALEAIV